MSDVFQRALTDDMLQYLQVKIGYDPNVVNDLSTSLAQITSQNNNTVTYGYDANGNVQTVTEKDSSNNVVKTVTYTYNASGDVATSITVANGKTTTTTYNYDTSGNITSTSNVLS
jgi:YD repeat-containing protein